MAKKRTKAQRSAAAKLAWARRRSEEKFQLPKEVGTGIVLKYKNQLLNDRERTHGDFGLNAEIAQRLKAVFEWALTQGANPTARVKEATDLICTKFGRLYAGDPSEREHWVDIAGYANLIAE